MKKIIFGLLLIGLIVSCAVKKTPVVSTPYEGELVGCIEKCVELCRDQPEGTIISITCGYNDRIQGECECY